MQKIRFIPAVVLAASVTTAFPAFSADLTVTFGKSDPNNMLPAENASCIATPDGKSGPGLNKSPALSWSAGPKGTRSYALDMVDPFVPADRAPFNQDGVTIAFNAKRMVFTHWVLADIPSTVTALAEGADGDGLPVGGLALERTDHGRRGQNGAGGGSLSNGPNGGYKGACPPWNDERIHHYRVTVYALNVDHLALPDLFTRDDLVTAMKGHILASGWTELRYAINAKAKR